MPTNEEIFAGPNRELSLDNLIQVAKTHRNVDIVRLFNAQHPDVGDHIHISTVGARISRGLNFIAERDGRDRRELKVELEAERARNGVAGRNQHTIATQEKAAEAADSDDDEEMEDNATPRTLTAQMTPRAVESTNNSDPAPSPVPGRETRAKKALRQKTPGSGAQRQYSTASSSDDSSPLAKKSKSTAFSASAQSSSAGKKHERPEVNEDKGAGVQESGRPRKKAKKTDDGIDAASASRRSSKAAAGHTAVSQRHQGSGAAGKGYQASGYPSGTRQGHRQSSSAAKQQVSKTDSSSAFSSRVARAREEFTKRLKEADTDAAFSGNAWIDDDLVLERASEHTIPEIEQMANRAARFDRHNVGSVRRRISLALDNRATRRGRRRSRVELELNRERLENDIQAGGMSKWR